jgi:hypothetical protein
VNSDNPSEPQDPNASPRPEDVVTEALSVQQSPTEGVQEHSPAPTRRSRRSLRDTETGQSIFIGLWILGTLATVAALAGAYLAGQYLANLGAPEPEEIPVVLPEVIAFPDLTGGPQPPGNWSYDQLRGGECISGYGGAFQEEYSVVPCEGIHDAELVYATLISSDPQATFPGEQEMAERAVEICDAGLVLNRERAAEYADLVMESSYPVDSAQWDAGIRVVYCFISRGSGGTLMGSLTD